MVCFGSFVVSSRFGACAFTEKSPAVAIAKPAAAFLSELPNFFLGFLNGTRFFGFGLLIFVDLLVDSMFIPGIFET